MFNVEDWKKGFTYLPLGLRTNNPGCLRHNPRNRWNGLKGSYKSYCTFVDFASGIRALVSVLMTYIYKYRLFDVLHILQRYAPYNDGNNPHVYSSYVQKLAGFAKLNKNIKLLRVQLPLLVYGITCMENGSEYLMQSNNEEYRKYLFDLVRYYIDEYLEQVVYPSKGKVDEL